MPLIPIKIRHTKTSLLRALVNNLWVASQESSSPALTSRPRRSMSLGRYSRGGVPEEFNGSIALRPFPVMDSDSCQGSDHEPKTDPGKPQAKILRTRINLTAAQPQSLATTEDTTAFDTLQGESHMRIQMLRSHQSDFVQSLGSLDPQQSEMIGTYKCMPLELDENSKWVVKNKDPILNLPTESVQDVKDHCQAAVDSGFMLLYEQLERVRLADDEFETSQEKEKLLVNLKSLLVRKHNEFMEARILEITKTHNEQMHRLQADLEVKLKAEQENYHPKVEKLKKLLCDCEAQRDDYERQLMTKDKTIESIMAVSNKKMSLNLNLERLLEESSAELARTRNELVESREHMAYLEAEWKEEHEHLLQLQNRLYVTEDKDQIIADLMLKEQQLRDMLRESEESTQSVQQVLLDLEHVKSELCKSQQLVGEMRAQANRDHLMICRCTEEIKTCRLKDTDSQRAYHKLYLESADKDMQINQMRLKLDSMEEQLSHAYEKQALQKQKIRRLEEFKKVSEDENARITLERDQYKVAKNTGKQQVENLTQQIQEFVDFLLNKGKPPAIIEGLIHVCSRCGCIHQRQHQSISTVGETQRAYFETLHNQYNHNHNRSAATAQPTKSTCY